MSAFNDKLVLSNDIEEAEDLTMTSLGKLIFVDIHSRHAKSSSSGEPVDCTDSLSLAFESLLFMPLDIIDSYANTIHTLDISHNKFSRNLHFLSEFENLTSLNLDHNNIDAYSLLPYMPKLQLLWLNHNNIDDLYPFIKNLYQSTPNLRYLCLMGNKAAPSYLNGGTFYDYLQYRLFVISWFPRLIHLDDRIITPEQREEAKRLFKRPFLESFAEQAHFPECIKQLRIKVSTIFSKSTILDKLAGTKNSNLVV